MATDPTYPATIISFNGRVTNTTAATTLVTGSTNGTRVEHLTVFNGNAASAIVSIYKTIGAVETLEAENTVATRATWNVLQSLSPYVDKQFILLASGNTLKFATATTAVVGDVDASGDGGNY